MLTIHQKAKMMKKVPGRAWPPKLPMILNGLVQVDVWLLNVSLALRPEIEKNKPAKINHIPFLPVHLLPILISKSSPISIVGWEYIFLSKFCRTYYKQTAKILIRRRIMRRLIWVYTVCLCPIKRTLGLYAS